MHACAFAAVADHELCDAVVRLGRAEEVEERPAVPFLVAGFVVVGPVGGAHNCGRPVPGGGAAGEVPVVAWLRGGAANDGHFAEI